MPKKIYTVSLHLNGCSIPCPSFRQGLKKKKQFNIDLHLKNGSLHGIHTQNTSLVHLVRERYEAKEKLVMGNQVICLLAPVSF